MINTSILSQASTECNIDNLLDDLEMAAENVCLDHEQRIGLIVRIVEDFRKSRANRDGERLIFAGNPGRVPIPRKGRGELFIKLASLDYTYPGEMMFEGGK